MHARVLYMKNTERSNFFPHKITLTKDPHAADFFPAYPSYVVDHAPCDRSVVSIPRHEARPEPMVVSHSSVDMLWKIVHSQQQQLNRVEHQLGQVRSVILGPALPPVRSHYDSYDSFSDYSQSSTGSSSVSSRQSFNYKTKRTMFRESLEDMQVSSDEELMSPEVAALIKKYTSN